MMTRNQWKIYRKKMIQQKIMGLAMLAICAVMCWMCYTATNPIDQDGTAVILLAPMALWMIFSKQVLIY